MSSSMRARFSCWLLLPLHNNQKRWENGGFMKLSLDDDREGGLSDHQIQSEMGSQASFSCSHAHIKLPPLPSFRTK